MEIPLVMVFIKWGEMSKEDIEDISTWLYKDKEETEHKTIPTK